MTNASRPGVHSGEGKDDITAGDDMFDGCCGGDGKFMGESIPSGEVQPIMTDVAVCAGDARRGTWCVADERRSGGRMIAARDGGGEGETDEAGDDISSVMDGVDEVIPPPPPVVLLVVPPSCVLRCCFMLSFRANRFGHRGQSTFFSPVCRLACREAWPDVVNISRQSSVSANWHG